jgi:hypothetical protein
MKRLGSFTLDEEDSPAALAVGNIFPSSERGSALPRKSGRESFLNRSNAKTLSFSLDEGDEDISFDSDTRRSSFLTRQNCKSHSFNVDEENDGHPTAVEVEDPPKRNSFVESFEKMNLFNSCSSGNDIEEAEAQDTLGDRLPFDDSPDRASQREFISPQQRKSFLDRQHAKSHSFNLDEEDGHVSDMPPSRQSITPADKLVDRPSWAR